MTAVLWHVVGTLLLGFVGSAVLEVAFPTYTPLRRLTHAIETLVFRLPVQTFSQKQLVTSLEGVLF